MWSAAETIASGQLALEDIVVCQSGRVREGMAIGFASGGGDEERGMGEEEG